MFGSVLALAFIVPDYDFSNYGKRGPLVPKTDTPPQPRVFVPEQGSNAQLGR